MEHFWETSGTIEAGHGFSHFDTLHISWLIAMVLILAINALWYRKLGETGKTRWRKTVAILILADELFKMAVLTFTGNYTWGYLPLHLCSINIFVIAIHAWKPSPLLSNFLYTICLPGALAALLFPSWTKLPFFNAMQLHSLTIHILLAMYPFVLATAGQLQLSYKMLPKCLGLLVLMAIPVYGINVLLDTNYMFLMYAEKGNPLLWFETNWGSHLLGFPVIIAAVLTVMYLPLELYRKFKKNPKVA